MSLGSKQSREEHRTHSRGARPHGGPALGRPPGLLGAKPGWLGPRGDTRSSAGAQRSRSVLGAGAPGCLCASGCVADAVPVTQSHSDPGREEGRAQPLRTRAAAGARGGRLPSQAAPGPPPLRASGRGHTRHCALRRPRAPRTRCRLSIPCISTESRTLV